MTIVFMFFPPSVHLSPLQLALTARQASSSALIREYPTDTIHVIDYQSTIQSQDSSVMA